MEPHQITPPTIINQNDKNLETLEDAPFLHLKIEQLYIDMNKIESLRYTPKGLRILDASSNNIFSFDGIMSMPHLEFLNLSLNVIEKIDKVKMPSLIDLDLSGNRIRHLENFDHCRKLEKLNLSDNGLMKIRNIPPGFNLQELNLSKNKITHLDVRDLAEMKHLRFLDLSFNTISKLNFLSPLLELEVSLSNHYFPQRYQEILIFILLSIHFLY